MKKGLSVTPRKRTSKVASALSEWGSAADCLRLFGIRQTLLYEWWYANLIKSRSGSQGAHAANVFSTSRAFVSTSLRKKRQPSDPLADLRGAFRLVSAQCGASADFVVMGRAASDAFESNAQVMTAFDKLRISPGELSPKTLEWGVQSLGRYRGIELYVHEAEYQDVDGSMKPYVPVDNVLIAATTQGGTMSYAGVPQVDQDGGSMQVYEGARIPLIYEIGEDIRKFRLSSRPVPVPHNLASWTILDVL
jgi:hypothetical protein